MKSLTKVVILIEVLALIWTGVIYSAEVIPTNSGQKTAPSGFTGAVLEQRNQAVQNNVAVVAAADGAAGTCVPIAVPPAEEPGDYDYLWIGDHILIVVSPGGMTIEIPGIISIDIDYDLPSIHIGPPSTYPAPPPPVPRWLNPEPDIPPGTIVA